VTDPRGQTSWLTQELSDLPASLTWLGPHEHAWLERLHVAKRRRDFLLGRWTAKRAIAAHLAPATPAAAAIVIRAAGDGAPEAFLDGTPLPLVVSISHSDGRALAVVRSAGPAIGCDLEHVEPRSQGLVDDFFTPAEAARVAACAPAQRDRVITLIWSAKESALKALRVGLREDPRHVCVIGDDAGSREPADAWLAMRVAVIGTGQSLAGWWRSDDAFVLTVVGDAVVSPPVPVGAG